jgi:hypothetical protein
MECRFIYPNGQHCRCRATTSHVYCRQHAPQPRVPTLRNRATPFRRWIDVRRALPTLDRSEIRPAVLFILSALLEEGPRPISDRRAGEILRALLRRFGSVPFGLADDPPPEPDSAFELSQSIDRLCEIIQRRSASLLADGIKLPISQSPLPRMSSAMSSRSPVESRPIPHLHPRGEGGGD